MPAGDSRSNFQNLDIVPVFDISSQKIYCSIILEEQDSSCRLNN